MEEVASQLQEWDQQQQLNGIDKVIDQLRDGQIQAQQHRQPQAQDRRRSQHRVDPNHQAKGDAPRKASGRRASPQKGQDRKSDPAIEKALGA